MVAYYFIRAEEIFFRDQIAKLNLAPIRADGRTYLWDQK